MYVAHTMIALTDNKPAIMHQPKGSMCACCVRQRDDCSDLDFDLMRVINRGQNVVIVHCSEWRKNDHR